MGASAKAEETAARLIATGIAALRELTLADLVTAIGTRELSSRAGVSVGTMYYHFGSVEGYAQALLASIYDPDRLPTERIAAGVAPIAASHRPSVAALDFHRADFDRLRADPEHRVRIGLWAFGGDAARAVYGDYLRETDARLVVALRRLHTSVGREVRPPFDHASSVAAHVALITGSVVRHAADPTALDSEQFARTAASLSLVMTRTPGDRRDIDDRLAEFAAPSRGRVRGFDRSDSLASRVLAAAERLFRDVGYEPTTLVQIAAEAGVGATTVYKRYGSKPAVALELIEQRAEEQLAPASAGAGRGGDDAAAMVSSVATFLAGQGPHLEPLMMVLAAGGHLAPEHPVGVRLAGAARLARGEQGTLAETELRELVATGALLLGRRILGAGGLVSPAEDDHLARTVTALMAGWSAPTPGPMTR